MSISETELRESFARGVSASDQVLVVDLADARKLNALLAWFPRLVYGTPAQWANRRFVRGGFEVSRVQRGDSQSGRTANRCPVTPENGELRHLIQGNKPHIYHPTDRVLEKQKQADALHIRQGARPTFKGPDVE
jgi:hypothetical protein